MSAKKGLSIGAAMRQRMGKDETPETREATAAQSEPLESFNTRLPRSLLRRLKVHAAVEERKIQDVVHEALEAYLSEREG